MQFIIFCAQYLYLFIVVIAIIFFAFLQNKKSIGITAMFSGAIAYVLAKISGHFINSPRPLVAEHIRPLIQTATDNGFPSDHTLLSMTIALIVFTYNKKVGSILIILALMVGIARVFTHSHHWIDILGSIGSSIIGVSIGVYCRKRIVHARK